MYRSIVVGTDGSPSARQAVDHAAQLAGLTGARLHLVSAVRDVPALAGAALDPAVARETVAWRAEAQEEHTALLDAERLRLAQSSLDVETHGGSGDPAGLLCDVARRVDADLLVVGNRGMRGARRVLGSVPNSVSHRAPCAVLIVATT